MSFKIAKMIVGLLSLSFVKEAVRWEMGGGGEED